MLEQLIIYLPFLLIALGDFIFFGNKEAQERFDLDSGYEMDLATSISLANKRESADYV